MIKKLYKLLYIAIGAISFGTLEAKAQANCVQSWTSDSFKSFADIQAEIKAQYGEVRILRIALCEEGRKSHFQVVIISDQGQVQRIQLTAFAK